MALFAKFHFCLRLCVELEYASRGFDLAIFVNLKSSYRQLAHLVFIEGFLCSDLTHLSVLPLYFSIPNRLEKIIKHPIYVPDHHDHEENILYLVFISNPQNCTYNVSSPLGSSGHCNPNFLPLIHTDYSIA